MLAPRGREYFVITAPGSAIDTLSLLVTRNKNLGEGLLAAVLKDGTLSLLLVMFHSQVHFVACLQCTQLPLLQGQSITFTVDAGSTFLPYYVWGSFAIVSCSGFILRGHATVPFNFINLANAYHSFSWHQFSLCYKSCLPWRSACYILNAMVKEISGELLFILTVLQQLSTWQECHNQSACYLFLTITWLLAGHWGSSSLEKKCAWCFKKRS